MTASTQDPNQHNEGGSAATYPEPSALRVSLRTALILLIFTLVFTAFMAGTYTATAPMLAASAQAAKLRMIGEVLPPALYDNDLLADSLTLAPQEALATSEDTQVYRARNAGEPVAVVFEYAANDGYSGRINLLLAMKQDGTVIAVRVTQHKETPGLGDYIDPKKDRNKRSPWINQFQGLGLSHLPRDQWRVKKDGGHFDQMSGATISARAVTNATGRALAWAQPRLGQLFSLPANSRYIDSPEVEKSP